MSGLPGSTELPDGTWIRGRGLRAPAPGAPFPDYGLYLGSDRFRVRHDPALTWQHDWLDWPDFRLPRNPVTAIDQIRALHQRAADHQLVEVACGGGVGRTGTVIACLAILSGIAPIDAVRWTRTHYRPRAVETPAQRRWVASFRT